MQDRSFDSFLICRVVEYNDKADFKAALRDLDGEKIDGKRVKISEVLSLPFSIHPRCPILNPLKFG